MSGNTHWREVYVSQGSMTTRNDQGVGAIVRAKMASVGYEVVEMGGTRSAQILRGALVRAKVRKVGA